MIYSPGTRLKDVVFLDPMDEERSFGLNVLHCPDTGKEIELDKAVGRVRDIFTKAWGGEVGYLGLWLDKILTNCAYLLLENQDPGYTLVDIPLVVDEDTTFRNELLRNAKVTTALEDFWYREFDRLTRRDKTEQVGPALTRINTLRTNHILRGIVGQKESTINFGDILGSGKIVLLRMPSNMDRSTKSLIGTIVLSEFLYAVHERGKLSKEERTYFGVYCDEFQQFATPDFADLFTQTGKFGDTLILCALCISQFCQKLFCKRLLPILTLGPGQLANRAVIGRLRGGA